MKKTAMFAKSFRILLAGFSLSACTSKPAQPPVERLPAKSRTPKGEENMVDYANLVDAARMSEAQIVIRGVALGNGESDKYAWVRVQVLATMKNTPNEAIAQEILVAYYSGKPGVPSKACTIYLEPYSEAKDHHWKLLGGSATRGVSHVDP